MTLTYLIDKDDYLVYQLYNASKSVSIQKKRKLTHQLVAIILVLMGMASFYNTQNPTTAIIFTAMAILWYIIYPKWERKMYVKHYEKFIADNFSKALDKEATIIIGAETIEIGDDTQKSSVPSVDAIRVAEIGALFMIGLKSGHSLIMPKSKLQDIDGVRTFLQEWSTQRNIPFENELEWAWK